MSRELAPIILFVYNHYAHITQTVGAMFLLAL